MAYLSPVLNALANAAKKASVGLLRDFNELEHLQNSLRNDGGFALRSRQKSEKILREELAKFRPTYSFITTENNNIPASGNFFAISAIDGYTNFAHGNGSFAISIALIEKNTVVAGVIYAPVYDELYFAEKGNGAFKEGFRNMERIRVASQKNISAALINSNADLEVLQKITVLSKNIIITGSAALDLAHCAAGKTDIAVCSSCTPAEISAGGLLIKEAGGYIYQTGETDVRSENLQKVLFGNSFIAANEALREKIASALAK